MSCLVSVVLPNYNHAHYLPKAIESILHEEHQNLELILIEDGSTDCSLEVMRFYAEKDCRVKIIKHSRNLGVYISMNEGIEAACGKYIHFLGADDFHMPQFLSAQIKTFMQFPEAGVSVTDQCFYHECPETVYYTTFMPEVKSPLSMSPARVAKMLQTTSLKISGSNSMILTEVLKKFGGFDAKLQSSCDWLILTKIALTYGANYIPQHLVCWKKNREGVSATVLNDKKKRVQMYTHVLEEVLTLPHPLFQHFKTSGELGCVLKYAPYALLKRPRFWSFLPQIIKRFVLRKWQRVFQQSKS